jgi:predicted phosphodiesterase
MAERTGLGLRNIYKRRERLSADGFSLPAPGVNQGMLPSKWTYPREIHVNIESGTVLVGNDAHIWPETHCPIPPIRKVFAQIGKSLKVDYTILNGDLVDGTRISRWPRLRGQNTPKFLEELQAAQRFCLTLSGHRIFVLGNHDTRLDSYLSNRAEEVEDMLPSLRDYLEGWDIGYSVVINDDVEVRHNFRGGIHTGYNNTLQAGRTMITGHTHQLQIRSWSDRRGIRWGVEGGMLADPNGPQFEWQLGMPNRWQAGFIVLTFAEGRLLPPEKAEVLDGKVVFRGKRYG